MSVNDMWVSFKSEVIAAIERFIPTKMTKTKYSYHGSTGRSDASLENARNFIFVLASQAALTLRTITNGSEHMFKRSSEMHIGNIFPNISNIFSFETESPDPDSPRKNEKAKKFWSFVKSLKNDAFGINTLKENGILKTDTLDKANICNR